MPCRTAQDAASRAWLGDPEVSCSSSLPRSAASTFGTRSSRSLAA